MRDWLGRKPTSAPERNAATQLRSALHFVLAGDLGAAESALAEAARVDSSSSDVFLSLANLYRLRGDIGRAIQIHQNLLLRADISLELRREAMLGLALDFRAGGFLKRSSVAFEDLLEVEPDNMQALRALERIRVDAGDWDGALAVRKRIGARDPDSARVAAHLWTGSGRAALSQGRDADARKAFKRALAEDAGCAEAYLALGDQRVREGSWKKASGLFRRALGLHAAIGTLLYPRLSEVHAKLGDLPGFESMLRERLDAAPDDREASLWLARTLATLKRVDDSLGILRRLLDREPGCLAVHAEIGRILLAEQRGEEARKAFEELLDRLLPEARRLACRGCGTQDATLHFRCPQCGEWDSFA